MDYGRCSIYSSGSVVYIDPTNNGNSNKNWGFGSADQAVWATEEDYGVWNTDTSVDADSNFDGRQSQTRSGSEPLNKSRIPPEGDVQPTNRSKVMAKIFFKTQLCKRFQAGICPNITNCNFAHSIEELRSRPPNWQELLASYEEEQAATELREEFHIPSQSSFKGRHCKKFLTKEGCPDGDYCAFLHDEELRSRESVAISLGPGSHDKYGGGASAGTGGLSMSTFKPVSWKTRICKWEQAGHCSFRDKCKFAHGTAELQWYRRGRGDTEDKVFSSPLDAKQGTVSSKSSGNTIVASAPPVPFAESYHRGVPSQRVPKVQMEGQNFSQKWKHSDKISLIYGDWFDDLV